MIVVFGELQTCPIFLRIIDISDWEIGNLTTKFTTFTVDSSDTVQLFKHTVNHQT